GWSAGRAGRGSRYGWSWGVVPVLRAKAGIVAPAGGAGPPHRSRIAAAHQLPASPRQKSTPVRIRPARVLPVGALPANFAMTPRDAPASPPVFRTARDTPRRAPPGPRHRTRR